MKRSSELEIDISKSLIFHSYYREDENCNMDVNIPNYSLGLEGYVDCKGNIYLQI